MSLDEEKPLFSSHIFMFVFRFDWVEDSLVKDDKPIHEFEFYKSHTIDERIKLDILNEKLSLEKSGWKHEEFAISGEDKHLLYNEFAYFYDYARDSIYNFNKFSENDISNYYRKKGFKDKIFEINVAEKEVESKKISASKYELVISSITLRVFHTGIAILAIELENFKHKDFKDILRINDYGRRVYPQFISQYGVSTPKSSFLANSILIQDTGIEENFECQSYKDVEIGKHIIKIFGEDIFVQHKEQTIKILPHRGRY